MNYEQIKRDYDRGLWSAQMVRLAVKKGIITRAECEAVLNGEEQ